MDSYSSASFASNTERLIASRTNRVKNKAPAEIQITAEQLLREASERSEPAFRQAPQQKGHDAEVLHESADQLHSKRKSFEDAIRRNRNSIGTWLKYAAWEEKLGERPRARSIYERVLEIEYRNPVIWLKYAEMEMKVGNIQHTRNVWNRAVSLLPRIDQFWYKWAYFEEKLGNIEGSRAIFERWIEGWRPPPSAFQSYVKLETRYKETGNVRAIYQRMIKRFSENSEVWIDVAKWEESIGAFDNARSIYEEAITSLGSNAAPKLFTSFAKFEIRRNEHEKARNVFQKALKSLPAEISGALFLRYTQFEKQHGTSDEAERIVLEGRVKLYEEELSKNPHAYDTWFERIWLEQELFKMGSFFEDSTLSLPNETSEVYSVNDTINNIHNSSASARLIPHNNSSIQNIFERAISNIPISYEKQYWRRFYLI